MSDSVKHVICTFLEVIRRLQCARRGRLMNPLRLRCERSAAVSRRMTEMRKSKMNGNITCGLFQNGGRSQQNRFVPYLTTDLNTIGMQSPSSASMHWRTNSTIPLCETHCPTEDIRAISDSVVFRRQLKTHYFSLAFNV